MFEGKSQAVILDTNQQSRQGKKSLSRPATFISASCEGLKITKKFRYQLCSFPPRCSKNLVTKVALADVIT